MRDDKDYSHLCLKCKGSRLLCGKPKCPLLLKARVLNPIKASIGKKQELDGLSPPSFFVGHFNYPKVYAGPMVPVLPFEDSKMDYNLIDNSDLWFGKSIEDITGYRASLVRTMTPTLVKSPTSKIIETSQELIMAREPTAIETILDKPVKISLQFGNYEQPMGPTGSIKRLNLQENPKVEISVEKVVSDSDLQANLGAATLYKEKTDVSKIIKLFSAGLLGTTKNRKLVPTRWSITAVDDILGIEILEKVRWYPSVSEVQLFTSSYLDNHFFIFLIPGRWGFEQFEAWMPDSHWNPTTEVMFAQDYEFFKNRTTYASNVAGGYYAARLAVLEYLSKIRRSAKVLILREIRSGYYVPLGVWQVRENARNAMNQPPKNFNSIKDALKEANQGLIIPINVWIRKSNLLRHIKRNKSLIDWFKEKKEEQRKQNKKINI